MYPNVSIYANTDEMFARDSEYDAVCIVTPHSTHAEIAIESFRRGKHVMCDKPAAVDVSEARQMLAAKRPDTAYSMLYCTRENPAYAKAKELVESGFVGEVTRAIWVCSNWYRSPAYHRSSSWRSSWAGEKGGLLINQCQHFIDIWQWIFGMPNRINASVDFGKFNDFLVDDCVDMRLLYQGVTSPHLRDLRGSILASSGEAPGVNRLEIWGHKGLLTVTDGKTITFDRNVPDSKTFAETNTETFGVPGRVREEIPVEKADDQYILLFKNFSDHIHFGTPLIADGEDGLKGLEIANAAYLSAWNDTTITLPVDEDAYVRFLNDRIEEEAQKKETLAR